MGLVDLAFVSTKMNSVECQNRCAGVGFTFQQDNATIHASRRTKTGLEDNDVATMDWPSRSPDLNPVENLWATLMRRIHGDKRQFETTKDLQCAICKAWSEVDKSAIKNLVNSMPERIFQVKKERLDNKGIKWSTGGRRVALRT
uniref:DDE_3 domain-containing protein n=1 Tax=Heterorhabditis bacteriophora TaxID=37862 RepID=A0A1I7XGX3_HETBA